MLWAYSSRTYRSRTCRSRTYRSTAYVSRAYMLQAYRLGAYRLGRCGNPMYVEFVAMKFVHLVPFLGMLVLSATSLYLQTLPPHRHLKKKPHTHLLLIEQNWLKLTDFVEPSSLFQLTALCTIPGLVGLIDAPTSVKWFVLLLLWVNTNMVLS